MQPADPRAAKRAHGHTISVCLPARNEESTIGAIVREIRDELMAGDATDRFVDEIVVIDDGSNDATAAVAREAGAHVVAESEVLPEAGPGSGNSKPALRPALPRPTRSPSRTIVLRPAAAQA